jgi:hypothetical protein
MGAKQRESAVGKMSSASVRGGRSAEGDIAESFRRARGALGEVARDVKQLRGRAGSLVKKTKPRG